MGRRECRNPSRVYGPFSPFGRKLYYQIRFSHSYPIPSTFSSRSIMTNGCRAMWFVYLAPGLLFLTVSVLLSNSCRGAGRPSLTISPKADKSGDDQRPFLFVANPSCTLALVCYIVHPVPVPDRELSSVLTLPLQQPGQLGRVRKFQ